MRPSGLLMFMLVLNLFFYFGASAIGETPQTNSSLLNTFWIPDATNISAGSVVANATYGGTKLVSTDSSIFDQMYLAVSDAVANLLGVLKPIQGLLDFIAGCFLMPFIIADWMQLTGAAKWIPAVVYYAMLVIALAGTISGRDV